MLFSSIKSNRFIGDIYKHLNGRHQIGNYQNGWANISKLYVSPRAKSFVWAVMHGKMKTFDMLHSLNTGPTENFVFCGLAEETCEHIFVLF